MERFGFLISHNLAEPTKIQIKVVDAAGTEIETPEVILLANQIFQPIGEKVMQQPINDSLFYRLHRLVVETMERDYPDRFNGVVRIYQVKPRAINFRQDLRVLR